jgi:hypothetical protein
MYFPCNWEFGSALSKLRNFGGEGVEPPNPLGTPLFSVLSCGKYTTLWDVPNYTTLWDVPNLKLYLTVLRSFQKAILNVCPIFNRYIAASVRRDSSLGIVTGYGLGGAGSSPGRGEIFRTRPDRPCSLPSLLYNGYRVFPGGKPLSPPPGLSSLLRGTFFTLLWAF